MSDLDMAHHYDRCRTYIWLIILGRAFIWLNIFGLAFSCLAFHWGQNFALWRFRGGTWLPCPLGSGLRSDMLLAKTSHVAVVLILLLFLYIITWQWCRDLIRKGLICHFNLLQLIINSKKMEWKILYFFFNACHSDFNPSARRLWQLWSTGPKVGSFQCSLFRLKKANNMHIIQPY